MEHYPVDTHVGSRTAHYPVGTRGTVMRYAIQRTRRERRCGTLSSGHASGRCGMLSSKHTREESHRRKERYPANTRKTGKSKKARYPAERRAMQVEGEIDGNARG